MNMRSLCSYGFILLMVPDGFIATMIFAVGLWFFIMMFWGVSCGIGLVKDFPKPKAKPSKVKPAIKPAIEPEPKQDSDWFGTWNDKPDDSWFDPEPEPEPQTDPQLIEEVISGLQNVGFKKKDAKAAVLKACEGRVFEDHQSLIEAALAKSNV